MRRGPVVVRASSYESDSPRSAFRRAVMSLQEARDLAVQLGAAVHRGIWLPVASIRPAIVATPRQPQDHLAVLALNGADAGCGWRTTKLERRVVSDEASVGAQPILARGFSIEPIPHTSPGTRQAQLH